MKILLIIGWVGLLGFLLWEFIVAGSLPAKYAKLPPNAFRIADILIGILAVVSIYYLLRK